MANGLDPLPNCGLVTAERVTLIAAYGSVSIMHCVDPALEEPARSQREPQPSSSLLCAALAGLLCAVPVACSTESDAESSAHITSSKAVANLSADEFKAQCDDRSGVVEVIPHCRGLNTCKGFSYDVTTGLLSEHTCRGAASCTGWNCLLD